MNTDEYVAFFKWDLVCSQNLIITLLSLSNEKPQLYLQVLWWLKTLVTVHEKY